MKNVFSFWINLSEGIQPACTMLHLPRQLVAVHYYKTTQLLKLNVVNVDQPIAPTVTSCCFSPTQQKNRGKARKGFWPVRGLPLYSGNAHTSQLYIDTGCHGYSVIVLPRELLHKQQRGVRRREFHFANS